MFTYSLQWYDRNLQWTAKRIGLSKFSSHWFRGTFATLLLEKGMDIREIQEILGHSDITTTVRYARVNLNKKETIGKILGIIDKV